MSKKEVTVTISGKVNTGKTALMEEIVALFESINIEVEADWGLDGKPGSGSHDARLRKAAESTKVIVKMHQLPRVSKT